MPYHGAFTMNSERVLVPHVSRIKDAKENISKLFQGKTPPQELAGDFGFILYPLPKVALCYIFYSADEEFPASCSCLFSANANNFMPIDGLADVGEYTSKTIIAIIDRIGI